MAERWLPVVGFEREYAVSDQGRVRSIGRVVAVGGAMRTLAGRILKLSNSDGYRQVHVSRDGRATTRHVHRLVLEAFTGPCPEGCETRHLNGDRTDNRLENLRYGTVAENAADRVRHGTHHRGESSVRSKLTAVQVREVRASSETNTALGRRFGVSRRAIRDIRSGRTWSHVT